MPSEVMRTLREDMVPEPMDETKCFLTSGESLEEVIVNHIMKRSGARVTVLFCDDQVPLTYKYGHNIVLRVCKDGRLRVECDADGIYEEEY